ncbi:hypothetical protein GQ457_01G021090 [Hibiscus cannabinus]
MDTPAAGEVSLLGSIKIAVLPITKVFTVCFMGFLMASKLFNVLPANGRKLLNGVGVFTFAPMFDLFSAGASYHASENGRMVWSSSLVFFLASLCVVASLNLVVSADNKQSMQNKTNYLTFGAGNIGNVPLVLIAALCRDRSNPFGDTDTCSSQGTAYISFG